MSLSVGAVVIGRNEGERLKRCLTTLQPQVGRLVYVDSGSTDGSVGFAESMGVEVVTLDTSVPFTAARARNAGFAALKAGGIPELVQFVDGDCGVFDDWVAKARAEMELHPDLGIVTGWRAEIFRDASVYNQMADLEWHRPAGPITACGGDMMVRVKAFDDVGGFDPVVIAAEDDEFCLRVGKAGWRLERLPEDMTLHDMAMTRFSEWWTRSVRNGHGFAQVGAMHPPHLRREQIRAVVYGGVLPVLGVLGLLGVPWLLPGTIAAYGLSYLRTALGLKRQGLPGREPWVHAVFLTLSKVPNLIGMVQYHRRVRQGAAMQIIEYK
jgi:GT2 family glycosyltransferase